MEYYNLKCVHMECVHMVSIYYWQASGASETLSGVTQLKIRDICLFMCGRTYVILYFDPSVFLRSSVFDPVPNCTEQNPPVYRSLPLSS